MSVSDGKLIIQSVSQNRLRSTQLCGSGITDENLHGEWDTGSAIGKEVC